MPDQLKSVMIGMILGAVLIIAGIVFISSVFPDVFTKTTTATATITYSVTQTATVIVTTTMTHNATRTTTVTSQSVYLSRESSIWRMDVMIDRTEARNGDVVVFNLTLTNTYSETQVLTVGSMLGSNKCAWYQISIYNSEDNLVFKSPWATLASICKENFAPNQSETEIIPWKVGSAEYTDLWPGPLSPGKYSVTISSYVGTFPPVELNIVE